MAKKVIKRELENLIHRCLKDSFKKYEWFKEDSTVKVNSIYITVENVSSNNLSDDMLNHFRKCLKLYVGKNMKVHLSDDKKVIIIQNEYEVIEA